MSTSTAIRPAARRLLKPSRTQQIPPTFLLPSLLSPTQQTSPFSSTTSYLYPRDNNRERGVSTQRATGLRQPVSISKVRLPQPITDPKKRSKVEVDPNHGLWDFFHSKEKPMNTPEEDNGHGRSWTVAELRQKSWEDLHALWWVCCKERNRIATERYERRRLEAGYGDNESTARDAAVRVTMRGIKQTLTERYYSWREAEELAKTDPEFDLSGKGPIWTPVDFVEEEDDGFKDVTPEMVEELQEREDKDLRKSEEKEAEMQKLKLNLEEGKPEKTTQPPA